ncbi:H(+)/Cl(-) exchange transporter 5 [Grifola frondosa]|uniref:H(+)/Cl(-) exchange transporter 5 n=1 Tax=Grifola frondosa TaxID=5627 RepID=A0A1C7M1A9_GRIFR|nr:H(+)/Cl(-) exchange transporter 5 [Grifola frondosa]
MFHFQAKPNKDPDSEFQLASLLVIVYLVVGERIQWVDFGEYRAVRRCIMSLSRIPSIPTTNADSRPSQGPLSGPFNTEWRRKRLLQIGNEHADETSSLRPALDARPTSYGTLPNSARTERNKPPRTLSRRISALPGLRIPKNFFSTPATASHPSTPSTPDSACFPPQRPISAYDAPVVQDISDYREPEADVKTNGIRVWYSSFTSIDWLHDAVKDSARQSRLRRRKSKRGRIHRHLDRSIGWIIVSIVGFFTAIVAFLIVRSEQWLFDVKEGYCREAWWRAKRFCCPTPDDTKLSFVTYPVEHLCPAWHTWGEVFGPIERTDGGWISLETDVIEYSAFTVIAVTLAVVSSLLTLYLTASTTFITRKDSGVLSSSFPGSTGDDKGADSQLDGAAKPKVLYYAAGSGIPEVKTILSGFVIHALSVASGLSLGKEGPLVHIASCVGNIVSRFFSKYETNEGKRREILSAASAAGVAVAFGAPIGGVLFSLEEVSYFFPPKVMWRSFFCAMVAAMTLRFLDPFGSGKIVLFQVTYDKDWHAYELIPFLLLGVFGGVYGAYFSKLNYQWTRYVRNGTWLKFHPVVEVILVTLATTFLCFINPYTRMGGTELVYNLFAECRQGSANSHLGLCVLDPPTEAMPAIRAVFVALLVKGALTIVTFGIKLPAGIFIPTLGVGACAGRILGILVQWMQFSYPHSSLFSACKGDLDCVIPGLYAMVGAAAALSGVTRTTVSLAVIMFELTDTLTYAVPIMLSVLVAKSVADALEPKGIYDLVIESVPLLSNIPINDVTDRDVDVIHADHDNTVKSLRDQLAILVNAKKSDSGFPILKDDEEGQRMVGYIGASELEHALSIVADHSDKIIKFHVTTPGHGGPMTSSFSSLAETGSIDFGTDLFDFTCYMDQAPLTVLSNSPLELWSTLMVTTKGNILGLRDYLSPVLKESKFKEHGRITPEEFVAAGDFLAYKFPVWTWEKGDASKARDYLPADKQYLITRGVHCLRRATALAYTDADEDAERLLSFGDLSSTGNEADEWVETHAGRASTHDSAANLGVIPDVEDAAEDGVAHEMGGLSLGGSKGPNAADIPDMDEIPDMEEEDLEAGEDEATAATPSAGVIDSSEIEYYQTPRIWLIGYDENRTPLTPSQIFQDVSADHAFKTVTIEAFPHSTSLQAASVHPCKHASVMKKVIERMNAGVIEEQQAQRKFPSGTSKDKQKKWLFRRASGNGKDDKAGPGGEDEIEGMRVDFYLVVFLKFIASIVPTIEVDSTTAF